MALGYRDRSIRRAGALLAALLGAAGCATVVAGSSQNVSVITDPADANCVFRRDGKVIGIVNPTPGTLSITKSGAPIEVRCVKEGYAEASGKISSHFQAATLGNVLLGGVVGLIVDTSSGAMSEYEPELRISLVPLIFPTVAERDAFFEKRRREFLTSLQPARQRITDCQGNDCAPELERLKQEEQAGLARIDAEYQATRIGR